MILQIQDGKLVVGGSVVQLAELGRHIKKPTDKLYVPASADNLGLICDLWRLYPEQLRLGCPSLFSQDDTEGSLLARAKQGRYRLCAPDSKCMTLLVDNKAGRKFVNDLRLPDLSASSCNQLMRCIVDPRLFDSRSELSTLMLRRIILHVGLSRRRFSDGRLSESAAAAVSCWYNLGRAKFWRASRCGWAAPDPSNNDPDSLAYVPNVLWRKWHNLGGNSSVDSVLTTTKFFVKYLVLKWLNALGRISLDLSKVFSYKCEVELFERS